MKEHKMRIRMTLSPLGWRVWCADCINGDYLDDDVYDTRTIYVQWLPFGKWREAWEMYRKW